MWHYNIQTFENFKNNNPMLAFSINSNLGWDLEWHQIIKNFCINNEDGECKTMIQWGKLICSCKERKERVESKTVRWFTSVQNL